jgi:aspartyl-tRNA(Asn)/glutamyl-tRNA(Gln) amidotransferase subunit C
MSLSRDDVAKVATLARLALSEDELAQMTSELTKIVGFVSLLEEIDTSSVEPLAHPLGTTNVFREDEPAPSLPVELAIATAPKQDGECFLVPAVLGD